MRFLVEMYVSAAARAETTARLRASRGILRSVYVPQDETLLLLVEGASEREVRDGLAGDGLAVDRVLRAIDD